MARKSKLDGIETRESAKGVMYRGTVYLGDGEKRRGPWTPFPDEAIAWRSDALRDASDGLLTRGTRLSLAQAAADFTKGIRAGVYHNKSSEIYKPSTVRRYARGLAVCEKHFGGKTPLDQIRLMHVARLKDRMLTDGASMSDMRNTIVALRALYAWAIQRGYATINPCAGLPLPGAGSRSIENIPTPEQASLLTACLDGRDKTAFALSWLAGLRAGEILPLTWDNVEMQSRLLNVMGAVDTATRLPITTKSDQGVRAVPIRTQLLIILEDHAERHGAAGMLFPALRGARGLCMSYSGLTQRLARRWKAAEIEPIELHAGRHTFVSTMIAGGASPKEIMEWAGHSSITVTYDRYGHLFPSSHTDALRRMDEYDAKLGTELGTEGIPNMTIPDSI